MSLDVSQQLLEQAQQGEIDDAEFVECIRTSLPYAWELISGLVADLEVAGGEFADNNTPPPDEQARGQLLRVLASDAMRGSIERYFGVKLAFQNCHRVAVFPSKLADGPTYRRFITAREQILNQSPHLRDC
ncbi:SCO5389 family protein [Actinocorallia longicatena]|uniref:SCO5389 family protein n=1 Tax=Actinocorallia longicatena TaxID=111803 RepID=A0ABP6QJP2_9ACTN